MEYVRPVTDAVLLYSQEMNSDYFCQAESVLSRFLKNLHFNLDGLFIMSGTQHVHCMCKCGLYFLTPVRCHNNVCVNLTLLLYNEIYLICFKFVLLGIIRENSD